MGSRTRQLALALALTFVGAVAAPRPARADVAADADRWFRDGSSAMDRDQPRIAADAYRQAWQLDRRAKIALDLGVALAEANEIAPAAEALEAYLADPASDPAKRLVVERQLAAWRTQLGRIALHVEPAGTTVAIDGVHPLRGEGDVDVPAAPGSHRVAIEHAGFVRREVEVVVVAGETADVNEVLAAEPVPTPRELAPHRAPVWIALGTAGVAAAVGIGASVVALERWNGVHAACPGDVCASPSDLQLAHRARVAGETADVAFAIGGAALVTAAALWHFSPPPIAVAPIHAGAVIEWQHAY